MGVKSRHRRMMTKLMIVRLKKEGKLGLFLDSIPGVGGEQVHKYLWEVSKEVAEEEKKLK